MVLRFVLWRLLGLLALFALYALLAWLLHGGIGQLLRAHREVSISRQLAWLPRATVAPLAALWAWSPWPGIPLLASLLELLAALSAAMLATRVAARRRRSYARLCVEPYRGDHPPLSELPAMFSSLHERLLQPWWRRLWLGQPSLSLEVHHGGQAPGAGWFAVSCPTGLERMVEAALRCAYPSCRLRRIERAVALPAAMLRLRKRWDFIERAKNIEGLVLRRADPTVGRLLTVMAATEGPSLVQLALTPAPMLFEHLAAHAFRSREARISRHRRERLLVRDRSLLDELELRGGLELQHRQLFFVDLRVLAASRRACELIASELRSERAENRLVARASGPRRRPPARQCRRVLRGEGNPLPSLRKGVFAPGELAAIWQLPSTEFLTVPLDRKGVPAVPAPPAILRRQTGGLLRDALGPVSIHESMRRQNLAAPGTVEQGKSSLLVASVAEDLRRERCAVIVLDPKGDAADAALSAVPPERTCTLLDFAHPTCGFNPLAVQAPADVIADYVVGALKNLFSDADIRASSDRYLRNAIIAVLAYERTSTLWDAARLLSVGPDGYAYRNRVAARVRAMPELKEISEFFTAELTAQLADARSTTTAKLDAPVNKLARLLNSPSIKRVLLNDSLRVDFDRVIADAQVLVVKGALGAMGAGNTSVLMQLLVGMLDAALARQQDLVPAQQRVAVALKVDEAPLVINRGFAETMALKRSAGLETVACWQTDAQWTERETREQLDALFAHRAYFATASPRDARSAASLTMSEFSDTVRPEIQRLSTLGRPDVRLHLPRHHALVSWVTPEGRQAPFVAQTLPLSVDAARLAHHAARQRARGARHLDDLSQPHWDERKESVATNGRAPTVAAAASIGETGTTAGSAPNAGEPPRAGIAAESYRELVELDGAHSAHWSKPKHPPTAPAELEPLDLEMLVLIATMRYLLSTQLHRRFNAGKAPTTTQRRLKRLADAGLVARVQFRRRDGGAIPMCYAIAAPGVRALESHGVQAAAAPPLLEEPSGAGVRTRAAADMLAQIRHHVHVSGWVLAFAAALDSAPHLPLGPDRAALSPPRPAGDAQRALAPRDLRLPGGRVPHELLRTDASGERFAADRFETLRPDALVRCSAPARATAPAVDMLVERDDRAQGTSIARKLERYDHFLAGWSAHVPRYGERAEANAAVAFVCRDRARARACARNADHVLLAARAYAGVHPREWSYPGREAIRFVAERDIHERSLHAYALPRLPPHVRAGEPGAAERAREASVEHGLLPTPCVAPPDG